MREGPGSVWAVTMVKDEEDVLPYTLAHMGTQGFDGIAISDNQSTDSTPDIIRDFHDRWHPGGDPADWPCAQGTGPFIASFDDMEPGYYQSKKMTSLAQLVHQLWGAEWIVPFDADELWHVTSRNPIADYLRGMPVNVDRVDARLFNHFPGSSDEANQPNPFRRIRHRDRVAAPLPKVALRWREGMVIHQGNHGSDGHVKNVSGRLEVRHFPWRSPGQFERKIMNGAAAYAATDLPDEMGGHWRGYGRILEQHGPEGLRRDVWDRWFYDPLEVSLVDDPAPYRGDV